MSFSVDGFMIATCVVCLAGVIGSIPIAYKMWKEDRNYMRHLTEVHERKVRNYREEEDEIEDDRGCCCNR